MRTITIGLRYFQGQFQINYGPLAGYSRVSALVDPFLLAMRPSFWPHFRRHQM